MFVVSGPGSHVMGRGIADILSLGWSGVDHREFADGESNLRIKEDISGLDVILVHSTSPPQDTRLIQLLFMMDALRERGANRIIPVSPYLAYARQDRGRLPGEVVSIASVISMLRSQGMDRLYTVNVHNPDVFEGSGIELTDISAFPLLAQHLMDEGLAGAFSVSLGKKPADIVRAKITASILGGDSGHLATFRDPFSGKVTLGEGDLLFRGSRVVIFDDVISSGRTHIETADLMRNNGAREVHLACVHALTPEEKLDEILPSFDGFTCTDTVPNRFSRVGVAGLIAEALKESFSGEDVT